MTTLEKTMVLHSFMCNQFHHLNLRALLDLLSDPHGGAEVNREDGFAAAIRGRVPPSMGKNVDRYAANISAHSRTLSMSDEKGRAWKPFQYLALLFTERYLDLYFQDSALLVDKLNQWKESKWAQRGTKAAVDIPAYTVDEVRNLAFQSATGSGKTLLLHANILQYRHYLAEYGQLHKLNKIILVTPDEGLSRQHLRELQASGIPARLFTDSNADVFTRHGMLVDIIDLHKLDEKKGTKRVALDAFEDNNLVMVDEGHLGAGGKVWRKRRQQLAQNGFTFEYSATFNQAVSGGGADIKKLRNEYGKSILFDYSYRFFYGDGYGKDYHISNLQNTEDREVNHFYLLACLLTFYQQCRIYRAKIGHWQDYNLTPPLWVFLGRTVTGGKTETETDVVKIIHFLSWVQHAEAQVVAGIKRLLSGATGLCDESGADIFKHAFQHLGDASPQAVYDHIREIVFRGKGQLRIAHLTGADELQIRAGDAAPFGVINVGNAAGLYTKLEAIENRSFMLAKDAFSRPLFDDVDSNHSPVNIVIGARRFVAGWNSWRVSTMGLMHVGTGEGPQIIQMFGRGIRLKGHGMSLKRHTALAGLAAEDSEQLQLLETLNIFGLKANYMDKFKDYLLKNGIDVEHVLITVPVTKQFGKIKDLKMIKKRADAGEFQYTDTRLELPRKPDSKIHITIDRRKHLQALASADNPDHIANQSDPEKHYLEESQLGMINMQAVYHRILERKNREKWYNMSISQDAVEQLLASRDWYTLHLPIKNRQALNYFASVQEWEGLAVDLICDYAAHCWRRGRSQWEHDYIEAESLNENNANYLVEHKISVDAKEDDLIREIKKLAADIKSDQSPNVCSTDLSKGSVDLLFIKSQYHAYIPLLALYADPKKSVKITPVPLNRTEARLVSCLESVISKNNIEFIKGKTFYLMRNLSRGKGVSFFDDYAFYPDFILWVKDKNRQDILFIDPKGLARYDHKVNSKVDLHTRIKVTEKKLQEKHPKLFLHAYVWSVTSPKNIGSDIVMTKNKFEEKGIYFNEDGVDGIKKMLQQALA